MKKIVLAWRPGAATFTPVAQKVATMLDANGYAGQVRRSAPSPRPRDVCDEGANLTYRHHRCPRGPLPACVRERRALHDRHEPRRCRKAVL